MPSSVDINTLTLLNTGRGFILFIFRKWILIVTIVFSSAVLGAIYFWMQKPKYSAELTFALEESSNDLGGYANLAAQLGFNLGGGSSGVFKGDNLIELMKSRFILEKTLLSEEEIKGKKYLLINYFLEITKKGDDYVKKGLIPKGYFSNDRSKFSLTQDSVLFCSQRDIAEQLLSVDRIDKKLSIISVSVTSFDQYFAIAFCKRLVSNLISFYVQTVTKKQTHNLYVLQNQADSLKKLMAGSMADVAISTDLNVNPLRQVQKLTAQRRQMDVSVYGMAYGEVLKNLELTRITLQRETPLIQVIDQPSLPLINKKKGRLHGAIVGAVVASLILFPILILLFKIDNDRKKFLVL